MGHDIHANGKFEPAGVPVHGVTISAVVAQKTIFGEGSRRVPELPNGHSKLEKVCNVVPVAKVSGDCAVERASSISKYSPTMEPSSASLTTEKESSSNQHHRQRHVIHLVILTHIRGVVTNIHLQSCLRRIATMLPLNRIHTCSFSIVVGLHATRIALLRSLQRHSSGDASSPGEPRAAMPPVPRNLLRYGER